MKKRICIILMYLMCVFAFSVPKSNLEPKITNLGNVFPESHETAKDVKVITIYYEQYNCMRVKYICHPDYYKESEAMTTVFNVIKRFCKENNLDRTISEKVVHWYKDEVRYEVYVDFKKK